MADPSSATRGIDSRRVTIVRAVIVVGAIAIAVVRFAAIDAGSHSASDTLRPWLVETAVIVVVATLASVLVGRFRISRG